MSAVLPLPTTAPRTAPLIVSCPAATWLIGGSTCLAIQWALVSLPPFFQMGTRFVAAGVLGALLLGGGYGATAFAQVSISSGLVVACIAVVPALVALFQWPYGGVRPSKLESTDIALGLLGVVLLTRGQGCGASLPGLLAMAMALAGGVVLSLAARR